jgi:hypothetical protein
MNANFKRRFVNIRNDVAAISLTRRDLARNRLVAHLPGELNLLEAEVREDVVVL